PDRPKEAATSTSLIKPKPLAINAVTAATKASCPSLRSGERPTNSFHRETAGHTCIDDVDNNSERFVTFYIQADERAVLFIHVWDVSLGIVVHARMLSLTPVITSHLDEACSLQGFGQGGVIEDVVVDIVEIILPPE